MQYLGHIVRPGKLEPFDQATDPICIFEPQHILTKLKSILSLRNKYRWMVMDSACVAASLSDKLGKVQPRMLEICTQKYHDAPALQENMELTSVLALPRKKWLLPLDIDACDKVIGFVLMQEIPDGIK